MDQPKPANIEAARRLAAGVESLDEHMMAREAMEIARTIRALCDGLEEWRRWSIHASAELTRLGAVFP